MGRLERKQKGIDMLISMAEELICKRGFTDWKLKIIGTGSGYEETRQQIEQCNLQEVVELFKGAKGCYKVLYNFCGVFIYIQMGRIWTCNPRRQWNVGFR